MVIDFIRDGEVGMSMPYDSKLIGDPQTKVIHGGAVFALLDTCCGAAAMSHPEQIGPTATIDLRVDYMRPATPSQRIKAIATCYNLTKNVAFVRAVALDNNEKTSCYGGRCICDGRLVHEKTFSRARSFD